MTTRSTLSLSSERKNGRLSLMNTVRVRSSVFGMLIFLYRLLTGEHGIRRSKRESLPGAFIVRLVAAGVLCHAATMINYMRSSIKGIYSDIIPFIKTLFTV